MDIDKLTEFFMWCTILSGGILVLSFILCLAMRDIIGKMHSKLFGISPEAINITIYAFLGAFKIAFIVFCLVPYIALVIVR